MVSSKSGNHCMLSLNHLSATFLLTGLIDGSNKLASVIAPSTHACQLPKLLYSAQPTDHSLTVPLYSRQVDQPSWVLSITPGLAALDLAVKDRGRVWCSAVLVDAALALLFSSLSRSIMQEASAAAAKPGCHELTCFQRWSIGETAYVA